MQTVSTPTRALRPPLVWPLLHTARNFRHSNSAGGHQTEKQAWKLRDFEPAHPRGQCSCCLCRGEEAQAGQAPGSCTWPGALHRFRLQNRTCIRRIRVQEMHGAMLGAKRGSWLGCACLLSREPCSTRRCQRSARGARACPQDLHPVPSPQSRRKAPRQDACLRENRGSFCQQHLDASIIRRGPGKPIR